MRAWLLGRDSGVGIRVQCNIVLALGLVLELGGLSGSVLTQCDTLCLLCKWFQDEDVCQ